MKTYYLRRTQFLPIDLVRAWDFFSSPKNLAVLTPTRMNFKILSQSGGEKMHEGQIIKYKVSVLPYVRLGWTTEITNVQYLSSFIDEQRSGPYKVWKHTHYFKAVNGGVDMTDELEYAIPFGLLGNLANALLVEREVKRIFDYRYKVLETYFQNEN